MNVKILTNFSRKQLVSKFLVAQYCTSTFNPNETKAVDISSADEKPLFDDAKYTEEEIMKMRSKSRLNPQHRNILNNQIPYDREMEWYHETAKYKARMLGRYGLNSLDVKPGIFWPSKEGIADLEEYEGLSRPWKLQDAWKELAEKRKQEKEAILARDLLIHQNLKNIDKWKNELEDKIAKKEETIRLAKEKKNRLIQEVRQHFGFKIDMKDKRFKELLEKKEAEEKKMKKAMKKEDKMKKYLEKVKLTSENKSTEKKVTKTSQTIEEKTEEIS